MTPNADIQKQPRQFLPEDFQISTWENLESYFKNLTERSLDSKAALENWLRDMSELEAVVSEDACWRQIRMTCDTENQELQDAFTFFMMEIQPQIQPYADLLNRKLIACEFVGELDQKTFFSYLRKVKKSIDLYREENVPIMAELSVKAQKFGTISGRMTIEVDGKEFTLQQASKFLEDEDRSIRESVYRKINNRRNEDKDALNDLFTELIQLRHQIAINAGFENYRDYKFAEMGRFDYTKEDCFQFHESVKLHVLPLANELYEQKKQKLNVDSLRPWDTEAYPQGVKPLSPFKTGDELLSKSIECLDKLNPFFGDCLRKMKEMKRLDLDSRIGKSPGGYNCPLAETGAPFIFMNAAGQMSDVTTMIHESGHAVHSFLSHPLELAAFKEYPTEIAEVASMAMELFSMDHWQVFFDNEEELNRAKEHQLERVITIFPWIATIDKFQHWIYENPNHNTSERAEKWMEILKEFSIPTIDYSGLEDFRTFAWQRQLHLFEVPFYYIEYGIAQLGAIGLWQQYKQDPEMALANYTKALSLGGIPTLPELFNAAGLKFDFSPEHIKQLLKTI
jgi:oligoendopeptidase F